MQNGQPIYFEVAGEKKYGIVIEVLPEKQGVKALIDPKTKEVITVTEPHKVRDTDEMTKVLESFGFKVKKPAIKKVAAVQPKPEADYSKTFDKALADIEAAFSPDPKVGMVDKLHLNGMGFKFNDGILPNSDTTATPIDKMFF